MLGPMTVGKKAASWGYKKYGVPGAVATGAVGVAGYVAVRRAFRRSSDLGEEPVDVRSGASTDSEGDSSADSEGYSSADSENASDAGES